jgi:hypothetical protein
MGKSQRPSNASRSGESQAATHGPSKGRDAFEGLSFCYVDSNGLSRSVQSKTDARGP